MDDSNFTMMLGIALASMGIISAYNYFIPPPSLLAGVILAAIGVALVFTGARRRERQ